jgi:hypothetical protein
LRQTPGIASTTHCPAEIGVEGKGDATGQSMYWEDNELISEDFDLAVFLDAMEGKLPEEIIGLADREALEAWRRGISVSKDTGGNPLEAHQYENALKKLIHYFRCTLKLPCTDEDCRQSRAFVDNLEQKRFSHGRRRNLHDLWLEGPSETKLGALSSLPQSPNP